MAVTPRGASVQTPAADAGSIRAFLLKLEQAVQSGNPENYLALLADTADRQRAGEFASSEVRRGATRVVLLERDREPIAGRGGPGLRVFLDTFVESGAHGRVATWQLDLRRTAADEWRITDQERLSGVNSLYRLFLNPNKQFDARAFTIHSEDLELTLDDGAVFTVDTDQGVTALVLIGRGTMRFRPGPQVERRQIEIFAGSEELQSRFDAAYVRLGDLATHADVSKLIERPVDPRAFQRADAVFREESSKSFAFDLSDFTPTSWTLLPAFPDLLAEVRTRRFGTLTYSKTTAASEDISLFDRSRQKNISVYRALLMDEETGRRTRSSGRRHFCKRCGSALWLWDPSWPDLVHPHASAIDTALPVPPEHTHIMRASKASWVEVQAQRKDRKFEGYPDESIADWHRRLGLVTAATPGARRKRRGGATS